MAIDLRVEEVLSLPAAAREATRMLPERRGRRAVSLATMYRWSSAGLRGTKLEIICIGGTRATTREALHRFFSRLADDGTTAATSPAPNDSGPSNQSRRAATAKAELAAAGI